MSGEKRDSLGEWRARLKPWLMATVRLAAGWLVSRDAFASLLRGGPWFGAESGPLRRDAVLLLLGAGLLAFTWPRTVLPGAAVFALGLVGFEWWWRGGELLGGRLPSSLAIVAVLALGDWLSRRVRARYPGP